MAKFYCSHGALFFVFFTVVAVVISTIQGTEGAPAKDGEASDLARAKRMDKQRSGYLRRPGLPLDLHWFGGGSPTKDANSKQQKDDSKQQSDTAKAAKASEQSRTKRMYNPGPPLDVRLFGPPPPRPPPRDDSGGKCAPAAKK
jgi:hypothetical protein